MYIFFLIIIIMLLMFGIGNKPTKFFLAGLMIYFFSFFALWGIGIYSLFFSIFFFQLAIAYTFNLVRKNYYVIFIFLISIFIWLICIFIIDDYWLFFPLFYIFSEPVRL